MLRRQCLCRAPRNYGYRAVSSNYLFLLQNISAFYHFLIDHKNKGEKFHAFFVWLSKSGGVRLNCSKKRCIPKVSLTLLNLSPFLWLKGTQQGKCWYNRSIYLHPIRPDIKEKLRNKKNRRRGMFSCDRRCCKRQTSFPIVEIGFLDGAPLVTTKQHRSQGKMIQQGNYFVYNKKKAIVFK